MVEPWSVTDHVDLSCHTMVPNPSHARRHPDDVFLLASDMKKMPLQAALQYLY